MIMSNSTEVTESNFEEQVTKAAEPVVVDIYAPWCGPCKALAPILDKLAEEFEGKVKFVKVNVDDSPGVAGRFNVTGVPTLLFMRDGEVQDKMVGFGSLNGLRSKIEALSQAAV